MRVLKLCLLLAVAFGLSACANKFRTYNGPAVTQIYIDKSERRMLLLHDRTVLEAYDIDLGFAPVGPKQFEGDGRTPEGGYLISHRNPDSAYHLSIGISYPNDADRAFAAAANQPTGGDIFIHGRNKQDGGRSDWTAGCISVKDREIEDIYAMVRDGTPIWIAP